MEIKGKVHCFFEQSGTFKNEFIKLGIPAEDYDIQNNFGETDHVVDLFQAIEDAYDGRPSLFDSIVGGGRWRPYSCLLPLHLLLRYESKCVLFCQHKLQETARLGENRQDHSKGKETRPILDNTIEIYRNLSKKGYKDDIRESSYHVFPHGVFC